MSRNPKQQDDQINNQNNKESKYGLEQSVATQKCAQSDQPIHNLQAQQRAPYDKQQQQQQQQQQPHISDQQQRNPLSNQRDQQQHEQNKQDRT